MRRTSSYYLSSAAGLVQRGRQPPPRIPGQWAVDPERVEHADHHSADVVARAVSLGQRLDQQVESASVIAGVEGGERVGEVWVARALELDARRETLAGEAAWNSLEQLESRFVFLTFVQDLRQRNDGVGPGRFELYGAPK